MNTIEDQWEELLQWATVDDVIKMLKKISEDGKGDYRVGCAGEYFLSKKDEEPTVSKTYRTVDFTGYA
jgi:hypothetical protein